MSEEPGEGIEPPEDPRGGLFGPAKPAPEPTGAAEAEAEAEAAPAAPAAPPIPEVNFEVLGAAHMPQAAQPTLRLDLGVSEASGREIFGITLTAQIMLDPARRGYSPETKAELVELFGAPERWPATTHSFLWRHVETMVHSFSGATTFGLEIPCTADLEFQASRYIDALPEGEVPMSLHFTGRVMYAGEGGRLQIVILPWTTMCEYRLPVKTWRAMMKDHHGDSAFIRLHKSTMAELAHYKAARGLHSFDACVTDLLESVPAIEETTG